MTGPQTLSLPLATLRLLFLLSKTPANGDAEEDVEVESENGTKEL